MLAAAAWDSLAKAESSNVWVLPHIFKELFDNMLI